MWIMVGALLLILVLPLLGLSKNWSVGIAIATMVIMYLWMMKGHSNNHFDNAINKGSKKIYFC